MGNMSPNNELGAINREKQTLLGGDSSPPNEGMKMASGDTQIRSTHLHFLLLCVGLNPTLGFFGVVAWDPFLLYISILHPTLL